MRSLPLRVSLLKVSLLRLMRSLPLRVRSLLKGSLLKESLLRLKVSLPLRGSLPLRLHHPQCLPFRPRHLSSPSRIGWRIYAAGPSRAG